MKPFNAKKLNEIVEKLRAELDSTRKNHAEAISYVNQVNNNLREENNILHDSIGGLTKRVEILNRDLEIVSVHRDTLMHGMALFRSQVNGLQELAGINPPSQGSFERKG